MTALRQGSGLDPTTGEGKAVPLQFEQFDKE